MIASREAAESAGVAAGAGVRQGAAVRREKLIGWGLLALACRITGQALTDAWRQTHRPYPGFGVMENLLVGVGGLERGGLEPFDFVRTMDGRVLTSGEQIQSAVRAAPPATVFHYIVNRGSRLVEVDVPSVLRSVRDFERFLLEGLLTALLYLTLGAVVLWVKPGVPETRLFLAFCLTWCAVSLLYLDAHTTYRWTALFLTAVTVCPAVSIHLALTFPERRRIARRHPRIV